MANEITRTLKNATLLTPSVTSPVITGSTPRIIGFTFMHINSNFTTTTTTFVDVTNHTLSVTAVAGDVLHIDVGFAHNVSSVSGIARIAIVDGGTTFNPGPMAGFDESQLSINARWKNLTCGWTVVNSGTVTVKGQVKSGSGAATVTVYGSTTASAATNSTDSSSNIRILHMRNL